MGTSESSDSWVGSAMLFTGRPDPTWPVPAGVARELEALWKTLTPVSAGPPSTATLGYRGCSLTDRKGRTCYAHQGVVTLVGGGSSESRRDPERIFERRLLASAPEGAIPLGFVDDVTRTNPSNRR
jgi:hypothetical protein